MFLKSIKFKKDVVFESKRDSHKNMFKLKSRRYKVDDKSKPIPEENPGRRSYWREQKYEKRTVVEKLFTVFSKDLEIEFRNLTVIVGDNGCGKTSLIKNLVFPTDNLKYAGGFGVTPEEKKVAVNRIVSKWMNDEIRTLDFEKMPDYVIVEKDIHKNSTIERFGKANTDLHGYMKPEYLLGMWDMQEFSNGENNLDFLEGLKTFENSLIVLDEPETSLSIKSQYKIMKLIQKLAEKNQIILITHSEQLMHLSEIVYDFEKKNYISTTEYIKAQKNA